LTQELLQTPAVTEPESRHVWLAVAHSARKDGPGGRKERSQSHPEKEHREEEFAQLKRKPLTKDESQSSVTGVGIVF
jgi:hypothetical protein